MNSRNQLHRSQCTDPYSSVGKESASNAGDPGSIPGSGRSPGEGNGNPIQYSCLKNPMDRGAWQAIQFMGSQESDMTQRLSHHQCTEADGVGRHRICISSPLGYLPDIVGGPCYPGGWEQLPSDGGQTWVGRKGQEKWKYDRCHVNPGGVRGG